MALYDNFKPAVTAPTSNSPALWFAFQKSSLLLRQNAAAHQIPVETESSKVADGIVRQQYLGKLDGQDCYSVELPLEFVAGQGENLCPLRQAFTELPEPLFTIAGMACQIVGWDRTHQFCGSCGARTSQLENERAKKCPECGLTNYPRLAPAVIVRVSKGEQILLSRSHHFPEGLYSVQAGFVEPGETLEEAVAREVEEEVGIRTKNIKYFGSQPWPFPNSLMIGFTAEYESGALKIDTEELQAADWFSASNLPRVSPKISIARSLIDAFVRGTLELQQD